MTSAPATHCRVSGLSRHLVSDAKALSTPPNHHHLEQRLGALWVTLGPVRVTRRQQHDLLDSLSILAVGFSY